MVEIYMTSDLTVENDGPRGDLEAELGRVMEHLVHLAGPTCTIDDPAISMNYATSRATIELTARGNDFDEATQHADVAMRTAIHAAGGATPSWDIRKHSQHVELIDA